ncbi:hypothetical protein DTL70_29740 [Streptomyces diacarni]|uniref:DUF6314 domain-containing protein n=1 Tax=Streptomyces diacarni TaxID=2800381 RepID=A0A367EBV7_9ACTN|nr:DUF6314 family protein [Streptomyces diacarni]RCG15546.1 hypothetical protein DTL70_29740 [Streptomyces diacarni]
MDEAPHPAAEVLSYLAGEWTVHRELRDGRTGHSGWFTGRARFRPGTDSAWLHVEEGTLEWGGARREAGRTLRLVPCAHGGAEVTFADGRHFHDLDLSSGRCTVSHQCGADLYEGDYTVVSPDEWRLRWAVHGPAKDQLLASVYRRSPAPGPPES